MPRQGKMPGTSSGITRVMAPVFIAPCGHRFRSRGEAARHEKTATCWKLPVLKTCKSCRHSKVSKYKDDGHIIYERDCRRKDIDTDALPPVHEDAPDVLTECPGWEFAGQVVPR